MTTHRDRCPAGHTFTGPDSWLRKSWHAAHDPHVGQIGAETGPGRDEDEEPER